MNSLVEVIIPTTAAPERTNSLMEAIDSVLNQKNAQCRPLILLNGSHYVPELRRMLECRSDLSVHYQEEGNLPKAIENARKFVSADYYCFLDDDDLLLDNSVADRLSPFLMDSELAVVVGNGYIERFGKSPYLQNSIFDCEINLINALANKNWLASCGGLYKSSSVGVDYFSNLPKYFEWTWVAFKLTMDRKKIAFVNEPTFRVRESNESLSKESGNIDALIQLTGKMLSLIEDKDVHKKLRNRLGAAYHMASQSALDKAQIMQAWKFHFKSMNTRHNFKYLSFTRHLLKGFIKCTG